MYRMELKKFKQHLEIILLFKFKLFKKTKITYFALNL